MSDISDNVYFCQLVYSKEKGDYLYLKMSSKYYKFFRRIHDCYYDIEEMEKGDDELIVYSKHLQDDLKELWEFQEMFTEQCFYILQDMCDKIKNKIKGDNYYPEVKVNEFSRRLSFFRSEFYEYNEKHLLEEDRINEMDAVFKEAFAIEKAQRKMMEESL